MFCVARKITKQTHKLSFFVLLDMLWCGFRYGAGYMDYFEFEFYLLNKKERSTFLTSSINNQIIAKYNDKSSMEKFSNKILFNQIFEKYLFHEFLDLREKTLKDFQMFCKDKVKVVGKVVDSCGGKGINMYTIDEFQSVEKLYDVLIQKKQYLVEEAIVQHHEMNKLYPKSVNTLRIISFLTDTREVVILNTVLRIGNGGEVDNFSSGGMYTFVSDTGEVLIPAIDEEGKIYETHPITKTRIVGFQIPNFEKIKKFIQEIALVVPEVRYVGWDVAVGPDGPILIEGNEYSGVFQMKVSLSNQKIGLLPTYKKYMDI